MPRPLPPGGQRRRAVPLRLSAEEEIPVQAEADAEHGGNLSAAIRALLAEVWVLRQRLAEIENRAKVSTARDDLYSQGIADGAYYAAYGRWLRNATPDKEND